MTYRPKYCVFFQIDGRFNETVMNTAPSLGKESTSSVEGAIFEIHSDDPKGKYNYWPLIADSHRFI